MVQFDSDRAISGMAACAIKERIPGRRLALIKLRMG
jgi:hypothetical protein